MTPALLTVAILALFAAWYYRAKAAQWKTRSQYWFSVSMGERPLLNEGQACRLMADLFPEGMPSVAREVASQKAWRERRALTGLDHLNYSGVDDIPNEPINDSFAAREFLRLCIGEREVDE